MKTFKRILSGILATAMAVGAASMISVGAANVTFTDVSGHWAWINGQIPYLVEKGVLNGYEQANGTYMFKPDGQVKRSEFIKMLDEVFGLTATASISFNDVKSSDWFYPYFQKAAAQGYLLDYGSYANPNGEITREEATALLVRYLDLPANERAEASMFADYSSISDSYKEYVLRAASADIINGYPENGKTLFKPQKTLSRAEALTILYRAAGCIFNESAYNRDGSAPETNNVITKAGITINNVRFTGRNIISEGANNGKITFYDCDFSGTLYVRGGADVTFDDCDIDNIVVYGGGDVTLVSGTEVETMTLEAKSDIGVRSGTRINSLYVEYGANDVSVSGDGSIGKAYIHARDFTSSMTPAEFEIGNNLIAYFGSQPFQGTSDTQNSFDITPFSTADNSSYYLNVVPGVSGRVYYYYTNLGTEPTVSSFDSYFASATYSGSFEVSKGEAVSAATYSSSTVKGFDFVVLQLQDGNRKYAPVLLKNHGETGTGFSTEPYLDDALTIKFKAANSATLYWFYADDGKKLNSLEFLTAYENKESALKGQNSVTNVKSFTCSLKEKYLENYSYVAFMLKTSTDAYYVPVVVAVGDNGFASVPTVKTPGVITFKSNISGDIYYYYSKTADLPAADKFKSEYNSAKYSHNDSVSKNSTREIKYDVDYAEDYPYMVMALRNDDGDYLQPVLVDINFTTGFENAPSIKNSTEIRFRTEDSGTVKYYYTKDSGAPTVEDFNKNYNDQSSKYRGSMKVSDMYETIKYNPSYAVTYPYMAIMYIDNDGKDYSPVIVELNATQNTGFMIAPYAEDGKVYFRTEEDGEVWYFYSKDSDTVAPEDFKDYFDYEPNARRGTESTSKGSLESFSYDEDVLKKYPYIVLAFTEDDENPDFAFPFVLDVSQSEMSNAGSGLDVGDPDEEDNDVRVEALYDGKLYWYRTDNEKDLPTSKNNFKTKYDSASSSDNQSIDAGESIYIDFNRYYYIVCALKVKDEYLNYVTIHYENGAEESGNADFNYDKNSYGFYWKTGRNDVTVTPNYDGSVQLLVYSEGALIKVGDSISVNAGEAEEITIPAFFTSDLASLLYGSGADLYLQFTDDDGNTYRPREIILE